MAMSQSKAPTRSMDIVARATRYWQRAKIMQQASLTRFVWLSIAAAIVTIGLKTAAYLLTGSVGLLSDAIESLVNLIAALLALVLLSVAERPPDEEHAYGHGKAEYFSSGIEGALILLAAVSIGYAAFRRLLAPQELEQIGVGLAVSVAASLVNFFVARVLLQAGKRYRSITLEADAQHLLTDVWTSVGVVLGVIIVWLTGLTWLDPVIAIIVALNIVWTGIKLLRRSAFGLLDTALPEEDLETINQVLEKYRDQGIQYHALRTRQSGARRFMSVHILVPGRWSVAHGHRLAEQIERDIREQLEGINVFTHIEPQEDPVSWEDAKLDRSPSEPGGTAAE